MYTLPVTVYYEDTDFSGVVYHANYLKFFERAREHVLGVRKLATLYQERGMGFVVHRLDMRFKAGAVHGDELEIRSTMQAESEYRLVFSHAAWRKQPETLLVEATVDIVCVDGDKRLVPLPKDVLQGA